MYLYTCYMDLMLYWMLYEFTCMHALIAPVFILNGLLNIIHDYIL